jgi:hypothetical protein
VGLAEILDIWRRSMTVVPSRIQIPDNPARSQVTSDYAMLVCNAIVWWL